MMRSLRISLIFILALFPIMVGASALDDAARDAGEFGTVLDQFSAEQDAQLEDAVREVGEDIFPARAADSSSSAHAVAIDEDPTFLTARVDGEPVVFRDVPRDAWFSPFVREMVTQGIVSGYREADGTLKGLFGPGDALTLEQLAKVTVQVAEVDTASCTADIRNASARGSWSEPYIRCAELRSWAVYADGSVVVSRPATRAQVISTLLQALGVRFEQRTGDVFRDTDGSTEFASAVETAARAGIISGDTDREGAPLGLFRPTEPVNRAEVAKIVTNALQVFGKE